MYNIWWVPLIIGAVLTVAGLFLVVKNIGELGGGSFSYQGFEFKSSSGLIITVIGLATVIYAATKIYAATNLPLPPHIPYVNGNVLTTAGQDWFVQVTALQVRTNADSVVVQLTSKGFKAFVVETPKGEPLAYRVRIGPFQSRSEADSIKARIQKETEFAKAYSTQ